jgi:4-hydroxy-tetrahydrodipicolinate synthase
MTAETRFGALSGIYTAIFTPQNPDSSLALNYYSDLFEFHRAAGVDGLAVCGTNGEGISFSVDERKAILEKAMELKGSFSIIAGTGATSVTDAVELTRHAARSGADAVLVLPPFFVKNPNARGLADYFERVMDSADIPVILYNIPPFTAVHITDEVIQLLAHHPNLAGVKDSAGDWERTLVFIQKYPQLRIFTGSDRLLGAGYLHGAAGCISGGANTYPEVLCAVRDAFKKDPTGNAVMEEQARFDRLIDITIKYPFITSGKALLAHRGLPRYGVRPPLVPIDTATEEALVSELKAGGWL